MFHTVSRAWRDNSRRAAKQKVLNREVEGQQPNSRTCIHSFVQGGTAGALPEPSKMTEQATSMHVSDQTVRNRFHEGGIRVQHPIVQRCPTFFHSRATF